MFPWVRVINICPHMGIQYWEGGRTKAEEVGQRADLKGNSFLAAACYYLLLLFIIMRTAVSSSCFYHHNVCQRTKGQVTMADPFEVEIHNKSFFPLRLFLLCILSH